MIEIVSGEEYIEEVKKLIVEYTDSLGRDLSFQHLIEELNSIETTYLGPDGSLLVALVDKEVVGCVAIRKVNLNACEMKRLYVRPKFRNLKIGQMLVGEIINEARKIGYHKILLDTIEPLKGAISLYKKFGFKEREAYYDNPMEDAVFMELRL